VNDLTDQQLLRDYVERRSDTAFGELVRRHIDPVYSATLRLTGEEQSARDATQAVFIVLAQKAASLTGHPVLSGWLHTTARNLACKSIRSEARRRIREQEAATMNEILSANPDSTWEHISPHLDDALGELTEADRDALTLRYFEKKSAPEMATLLGITEEAAQKRVSRAVDRLRDLFAKRKVTVGASGLVVLLSANAVHSAPVGLAVIVSTTALTGTAVTASTLIAATKTIAMTTLQKVLVTATVAVLAGTGIFEAHQAALLRDQNQALQQQQAPLTDTIAKLQAENERLSNSVAQARDQKELSQSQLNELIKLRGQAGQAQTAAQELAKARTVRQPAPGSQMPAFLTNAMAQGISMGTQFRKKEIRAKIARMKDQLHLTDDQSMSISNLMTANIETSNQQFLQTMSGGMKPEDFQEMAKKPNNEEADIKALLSPDQVAAYPDFKHAEALLAADNSAKSQANSLAGDMDLSSEQKDKIHSALYQYILNQPDDAKTKDAITQARTSGHLADAFSLSVQTQKQALEDKLKLLGGILTSDQLATYKQKQLDMLEMQISAMKMFLPSTNAVSQATP